MLFQKIQKILNIDIRKTSALKTRMRMRVSKKCGTSADADADIRPIPTIYKLVHSIFYYRGKVGFHCPDL